MTKRANNPAEARIEELEEALLAIFIDPLASHGARALARATLGIPYIPFTSPEEMLVAHRETAQT